MRFVPGSDCREIQQACVAHPTECGRWRMQNSNEMERLIWHDDRGDYQFVSAPRPLGAHPAAITLDGKPVRAESGEWLIDSILRAGEELAHVCYHPQMGPIQSCDTCMVEVDGKLMRACATKAAPGQTVLTKSPRAQAAQKEAFDRLLGNHMLYCTVCDNNNGNCEVHNTTALLHSE